MLAGQIMLTEAFLFVCLQLKYDITWRCIRWGFHCTKQKRDPIWILPNISFYTINLNLQWSTPFITPTKCTVLNKVASPTCVGTSVPQGQQNASFKNQLLMDSCYL